MKLGKLYKVLDENGYPFHGGRQIRWRLPVLLPDGTWRPGRWMRSIPNPEPCIRGYHVCEKKDILWWLGPTLYEAEVRGKVVVADMKVVAESARLLRPVFLDPMRMMLYLSKLAEDSLPRYEAYRQFGPSREKAYQENECARKKALQDIERARYVVNVVRRYVQGEATEEEYAEAGRVAQDLVEYAYPEESHAAYVLYYACQNGHDLGFALSRAVWHATYTYSGLAQREMIPRLREKYTNWFWEIVEGV